MNKSKDFATPIVFLLLSILGLSSLSSMNELSVGFPLFILIFMLIFSVILLIQTMIGKGKSDSGIIITPQTLVTAIALIVYVAAIWLIGFFFSSLLYLGFMTWYLQKDKHKMSTRLVRAAIGSGITTTVFYVTFRFGLQVYLPTGILF